MLYFDTSFLAPLVVSEATSESITVFFDTLDDAERATSQWTRVECASLIARILRMDQIDTLTASQYAAQFDELITSAFKVFLPEADDFDRARRLLAVANTGLRAGDALHLAIAANRNAGRIYTLDKGFVRAGRLLGQPVEGLDTA
jgi:predicted nucleic acid-binding protein